MKTSRLPVPLTRRSARRTPFICAASIALSTVAAQAATFTKADNLFDLNLPTSWSIGSVPGAADIAQWDATVTTASTVLLGANLSWSGLRILNPNGLVTINAGSTLTLGTDGIDLALATQSLTLNNAVTLLTERTQNWTVGAGTTLQVDGALTRGLHAMLNFDTTAGGTINIATGTASAIFPIYATINRTDFAALDASKNVVPGKTSGVVTYTDNPNTGAALPTLGTTTIVGVYDVVNSNTNAISAFRLGNTYTISSGGGVRFNTPHASGQDWVVDINSRNYNTSGSAILVTPGVGAKNVIYNGSTGNIRLGAGAELPIHQHNTAGDLILNAQVTQPAGAGATLTKDGAGRLILGSSTNSYLGSTKILEGTLQLGNGGTTGAIVAGTAVVNHGTLAFNRTDGVTFNNPISGTGAVTQAGIGTLSLTGANTYTGA
ncbi:MAG: autotransporter-associated beta strand repeat-containing protein, partial [Chthoniobacteraceae bacterium]